MKHRMKEMGSMATRETTSLKDSVNVVKQKKEQVYKRSNETTKKQKRSEDKDPSRPRPPSCY